MLTQILFEYFLLLSLLCYKSNFFDEKTEVYLRA